MTTSTSYTLEVKSLCWVQTITIDSSSAVFASPALTQDVWQPEQSIHWSDADLTFEYPGVDCGAVAFSVVNQDDSAIDASVFTAVLSDVLGATQTLSVHTEDSS